MIFVYGRGCDKSVIYGGGRWARVESCSLLCILCVYWYSGYYKVDVRRRRRR